MPQKANLLNSVSREAPRCKSSEKVAIFRQSLALQLRGFLPPSPPAEKATARQASTPVLKRVGYSTLLLVGVL
jgi:CRISPR/Cas system endoribonuclease Cas6 (RAMP superfamily)